MDLNRAKKIFDEIKDLRIELLRDPASLGADYLREQIALCRNYLNKVSYYLQETLEETHILNMHLDELESQFQVEHDEMLANDNRVKHLPAVEDREAMINVLQSERVREIKRAKREITNLKHIEKVIRHRKQELDNTMSTLRLQTSLLRDQIRSGLSYGDDSDREEKARRAKEGDDIDLDALIDESAAELEGEGALVANVEGDDEEEEGGDEDEEETVEEGDDEDEVVEEEETAAAVAAVDEEDDLDLDLEDDSVAALQEEKTSRKAKSKPKPAEKPKVEEEDNLFDGLEDLISSGGVDGVLEPEAIKSKEPAQDVGDKPKANPNPLKEEDIDSDMQTFLDEETGDGLDELLAGI